MYNANKAFVKSFSQPLSEETRNTGVRVTAPCPGLVATEFDSVASRTAIRQGVLFHQKCAKGGPTGPQARFPTGGPQTGGQVHLDR